jgi:glycerol-3-phosphate dehydrogenase
VSAFAGLRPLVAPSGVERASPSAISREETIISSASGLISLAGGKLTTYRRVAIAVVAKVVAQLRRQGDRRSFPKSQSHRKPLVGARATNGASAGFDQDGHLRKRYGGRIEELVPLLEGDGRLREPLAPPLEDLWGEICMATKGEMAVRLEDVLRRRLHVALRDPSQGLGVAREVTTIMADALGWDEPRRRQEEDAYRRRVEEERRAWGSR